MDVVTLISLTSIIAAAVTIILGSVVPAIGESKAAIKAIEGITQQPDAADDVSRTLFISMAMIESTAIYCFVVSMIILFANPFWAAVLK